MFRTRIICSISRTPNSERPYILRVGATLQDSLSREDNSKYSKFKGGIHHNSSMPHQDNFELSKVGSKHPIDSMPDRFIIQYLRLYLCRTRNSGRDK
jgi:hypothetical protein